MSPKESSVPPPRASESKMDAVLQGRRITPKGRFKRRPKLYFGGSGQRISNSEKYCPTGGQNTGGAKSRTLNPGAKSELKISDQDTTSGTTKFRLRILDSQRELTPPRDVKSGEGDKICFGIWTRKITLAPTGAKVREGGGKAIYGFCTWKIAHARRAKSGEQNRTHEFWNRKISHLS